MGLFDSIFGKDSQHGDIDNLASKVGLTTEQTETAIAALAKAHQGEGDTVATAAAQTGLDASALRQIVEQIGGEGSLTEFARIVG